MTSIIPIDRIENKILLIRGQKVMLDRDLAMLYGVPTKRLNEQVRRNIKRFPADFMFRLTKQEMENVVANCDQFEHSLRSQIATLKPGQGRGKHIKYLPYMFTEQGIAMLSSVLKSDKAIKVNIAIMRIFVNIRKFVSTYEGLAMKIAELEKKYDKKIYKILNPAPFKHKNLCFMSTY